MVLQKLFSLARTKKISRRTITTRPVSPYCQRCWAPLIDHIGFAGHICERTTRARLGQGDPPGTSLLPTAHPLPVRATLAADPPGSPFHTRDFADPPGSPFRVPPLAPWVPPPGSPLIFPLRAHPPPLAQPSGRCSPPAQILPTAKRPRTARGYPGDPLEERAKSEEKDDSSSTTMDENVEDAAKPVVNADMELKVEKVRLCSRSMVAYMLFF